ncbi:MAG: N-acetyltransferase [Xanthomonadaceae bacterium]|nr:N-acetyltransferase [Xanthomonadaceae bacterium]MDP2186802.1 N-acetyltransferase [Xanthomonadales bacterium]MDZ4117519.1 N-acetyltransferase [Xanthomonadaceae bacterium]
MPPDPISIRSATPADATAVAAMVESYWRFEGIEGFAATRVEATLVQLLCAPAHGAIWIARGDDENCGYLIAMYVFSIEFGGLCAEIDELWLAPEQRGSGAGRLLLDTAERAFIAHGCVHVALQVGTENDSARGFYHHLGYQARTGFRILHKPLDAV